MTPEQLQELRAALPPFARREERSPLLREFCNFYGIEFGERYPGLEHRVGTVRSGGYALAVHFWHRPEATHNLLLLHGYFDHTGLFGKLVEYGLSRGCNVVAFDLPGHGLSSGEPAAIDDFRDYSQSIEDVLAAVPLKRDLPLWVIAQSTGCAALVEYARHHTWPFSASVMLAPLVRPVSWVKIRVAHRLLHRFRDHVPRKFMENSSDRDFLEFLQRDPLQSRRVSVRWVGALRRWLKNLSPADLNVGPALIIQGGEDSTVDWKYNLSFIDKLFPRSRVEYIPGGSHHLANESEELRQHYYRAVDDYMGFGSMPAAEETSADPQKTSAPQ